MSAITVEIQGLEELRARLRAAPPALRLEQRRAVSAAVAVIKRAAEERVYTRSGRARRGFRVRVRGSGIEMSGRVSASSTAARFSILGRRSGQMPPIRPIEAWLRRSGAVRGTFDIATRQRVGSVRVTRGVRAAERNAAFLVARAIARRGTSVQSRPTMRQALAATRSEVESMFREALVRVARAVAAR